MGRSTTLLASFVLVLTSSFVASCANGPGGGSSLPPITGPYGDVLGAACDYLDRCPDALGVAIAYRSRAECQNILDFSLACRLSHTDVGDTTTYSVVQTRPMVSDADAAACIGWLMGASCDALATTASSPCEHVLSPPSSASSGGGGPAGTACTSDGDCASGLFCPPAVTDSTAGTVTCRVCTPLIAEGGACPYASTPVCAPGLACAYTGTGLDHVCRAPAAAGAGCYDHAECASGFCNTSAAGSSGQGVCDDHGHVGDPCASTRDCRRTEAYCEVSSCQALLARGVACTDGQQCANGNCDGTTHVCGAAAGASCGTTADCASGACSAGTCMAGGGGNCSTTADCASGEVCLSRSGQCSMPLANGGPCGDDVDCSSHFCDTSSETCVTRAAIGDPCTSNEACGSRAYCDGGRCVARHGPDAACTTGTDTCLQPFVCLTGRCELIDLSCRPGAAGQQCAFFRVCDDASYCDLLGGFTCRTRIAVGAACTPSPVHSVEVCAMGSTCRDGTCTMLAPIDGPCMVQADCAPGGYCADGTCHGPPYGQPCEPFSSGVPCPDGLNCDSRANVCLPRQPVGGPCHDDAACDPSSYCPSFTTCVARPTQGMPCNRGQCGPGLYCDIFNTSQCQPLLAAGTSCDTFEPECMAGLFCDSGTCGPQHPAGGSCTGGDECASGVCYQYQFCQATATCMAP